MVDAKVVFFCWSWDLKERARLIPERGQRFHYSAALARGERWWFALNGLTAATATCFCWPVFPFFFLAALPWNLAA